MSVCVCVLFFLLFRDRISYVLLLLLLLLRMIVPLLLSMLVFSYYLMLGRGIAFAIGCKPVTLL